ncbi:TANC1 [Symbiodinium sp. CCMP2592]|nr:TANC1 [Symbiodinium sp. CCMP2592]
MRDGSGADEARRRSEERRRAEKRFQAERGLAAPRASSNRGRWTATQGSMSSIYGTPAAASAGHRAASTPFKEPAQELHADIARMFTCTCTLTFTRSHKQVEDHRFKDPGGLKSASWHGHHEVVCPPDSFDAQNLSEEERLERQLQLEAECNGVESGGYVAAEALNEHPSALPGFDRRLWSADPFYAWRTQELQEESVASMPMKQTMGPAPHIQRDDCRPPGRHQESAEPSQPMMERKEVVQEPASWLHWFQAGEKPSPPPPKLQPRPSAPLPSSASMAPRWDKEKVAMPIPAASAPAATPTPLLPEPSPAELRERLEPELVAAGLSWDEVDEHLWSELRSVGELRRAAAYPHTFPRRLAALCAPLGRRMAAAEARSFLEPELLGRGAVIIPRLPSVRLCETSSAVP